jgi:hypothetical protein
MQRRSNWKPVIVPTDHGAEKGYVGEGEPISQVASKGEPTGDEDRLVDIRFAIAIVLALGLPVLIGAVLYIAVSALLRSS